MDKSGKYSGELTPVDIDRLQELADSDRPAAWVIDRVLDTINSEE